MSVDLKGDWTDADLAALLGGVTDDRDWRLEVSAEGIASLADKTNASTGADDDTGLHGYFETWMAGTDFVGPGAAGDRALVGKLARALRANYPELKAGRLIYPDF